MRSVIAIGISTFLGVVAALWCVSWYIQAKNVRDSVEGWIAYINTDHPYITYENMEISGFPMQVKATLTNPSFSGRMDQILTRMDKDKALFPHALPQWQEQIKIDGNIAIAVNAFSDKYRLEMAGKYIQHSDMNGTPVARITTTEPFSSVCELQMDKGTFLNNMWNFKVIENFENFSREFRSVHCAASAYATADEATGTPFTSAGPTQLYLSKRNDGGQNELRFQLKLTDAEITAAGEAMMMAYIQALSPDYFYPPMYYARYGKQNIEMDFIYKGPNFAESTNRMAPFEINLAKFELSNDLYSGTGHLLAKSEPIAADNINATLNARFEFRYSDRYDAMLQEMAKGYILHVTQNQSAEKNELGRILSAYTPEQAFTMIQPAIPKLSPLGTMLHAIDLSYQGKTDMQTGNLHLADFALTATPYGITGSGTANRMEGNPLPDANFSFKCTACTLLLDDVTAYMNRVFQVLHNLYPEDPQYSYRITPELVQGLKQFLSGLSNAGAEQNAQGNYSFAITRDPAGGMLINSRNLMEVMALYQQHVASKMVPQGQMPPPGDIPAQGWKVE